MDLLSPMPPTDQLSPMARRSEGAKWTLRVLQFLGGRLGLEAHDRRIFSATRIPRAARAAGRLALACPAFGASLRDHPIWRTWRLHTRPTRVPLGLCERAVYRLHARENPRLEDSVVPFHEYLALRIQTGEGTPEQMRALRALAAWHRQLESGRAPAAHGQPTTRTRLAAN